MTRYRGNIFRLSQAVALGMFAALQAAGTAEAQTARPNILFMLVDNLGYGELGAYGGGATRGAPTPRIDRLASEGLRLTNMNMEAQCTPSRSALLTGRYYRRVGVPAVMFPGNRNGLPRAEITIAEVLKKLGYRTIIVMPENQSKEKMDTLRALGAELVLVPPTKFSNPGHFVHTSRRLAEETEGAVWANQFDNIANRKAHIESTAPEIWTQMEGRIDGFTCAAGTGGTIAGVGMGLKSLDDAVTIALTDPHGAALYEYYAHGELKAEGTSVAEGIGQGRITANLEGAPIDTQFRISDAEGVEWVGRLLAEEGLCLGLSTGINVAGAVALGRQLVAEGRKDVRVATILCDTGFRYLSTLYNAEWLAAKGLPVFPWLTR